MNELLQYCDKMNAIIREMNVIVVTDIADDFERVHLLQELDTLEKYGIHNLRTSIENSNIKDT